MKIGGFEEISATSGFRTHTRTATSRPTTSMPRADEITGRRLLMWNNDVEISLARPKKQMDYFFRNGEGDEVVFVHEGTGMLETIFGNVPYKEGDYIVIPRGTTYRFKPEGEQRYLVFETPGLIEIPKRYRNQYGQIFGRGAVLPPPTSTRRPS